MGFDFSPTNFVSNISPHYLCAITTAISNAAHVYTLKMIAAAPTDDVLAAE